GPCEVVHSVSFTSQDWMTGPECASGLVGERLEVKRAFQAGTEVSGAAAHVDEQNTPCLDICLDGVGFSVGQLMAGSTGEDGDRRSARLEIGNWQLADGKRVAGLGGKPPAETFPRGGLRIPVSV